MDALLIHIEGPPVGAVVVDLERDRVIAESPAFRFMESWTRNQVNLYLKGKTFRAEHELLGDSKWPKGLK